MTALDPNILAPRGFDDYYRNNAWIKDQLKLRRSSIGYLERATVPGAVTTIREILRDPTGSIQFCNTDSLPLEGVPGDVTFALSHYPKTGSLKVWWGTNFVPPTNWSLDGNLLTVFDTDLVFGNETIWTAYAYDASAADPIPIPPDPGALLPFASAGWKWLQVARTDATDYSAAAFDDSGWATATAGFGDGGDMADDTGGPHATLWAKQTRMWARRTLTGLTIGQDINVTIRVDRDIVLYLDGANVHASSPNGIQSNAVIAGSAVTATSMVLACRATDEASSLGCYFDVEMTQ